MFFEQLSVSGPFGVLPQAVQHGANAIAEFF
jgi:hypothetical protein